jgi:Saxitoxin biosynthesis operon protein SxtJ
MQTHETISSFRKVATGSNRKFGITFAVLFGILGVWPLFHHNSPKWWLIAISSAFLVFALLLPHWLAPLNRAWFKLGLTINAVVSPIIMGVLFFGAVVPLGWYLRRKGKDPLRLRLEPEAATYWIERNPPGPAPGTLTKQF